MRLMSALKFVFLTTSWADGDHSWCYQGCVESPSHWWELPNSQCGGPRQSPINIDPTTVTHSPDLKNFTFTNFSDPHSMSVITNTGHTVKCVLVPNALTVKDGGLNDEYYVAELHFHWGDSSHPGSEHTIDRKRYRMEMHIVSLKKGLTLEEAKRNKEGIAVLGFFINEEGEGEPAEAWVHLTSYLVNISMLNASVNIRHPITISSLLGKVDLTKFYRYSGSLTTPLCNEGVVWTVFQEPINVRNNVISLFPSALKYGNVYRPTQELKGRKVYASPPTASPTGHSWCYHKCGYSTEKWNLLPDSQCGGKRQSPVNISSTKVTLDTRLKDFIFTNFSHPHSISYLKNIGHTVNCMLVKNMLAVSGGGLKHQYSTVQLHFHWGDSSGTSAGSEHAVDSKRYPMEMHIVSMKKGLTQEEAAQQPEGFSVLGFFIEVTDGKQEGQVQNHSSSLSDPSMNEENKENCWRKLTSYLKEIKIKDSTISVNENISLDCLIGDVDRSKYYRYHGSLTTPTCNEAVVWTIFKQPVRVNADLVKMFPDHMGYSNVFRPLQPLYNRRVYTSSASAMSAPVFILLLSGLIVT